MNRQLLRMLAIAVGASALLAGSGCTTVPAGHDAGPISIRDRSIDGDLRLRAAGPFYERRQMADGGSFVAFRPFYSELREPGRNRRLREYVWPLGMVKDFRNERFWRAGVFYGTDSDINNPSARWRCILFPFVFTGRDAQGKGYFAVFPIGGTIHEFIGLDRVRFVLWPLYNYSSVGEVESHTVLWPLFSRTRGGGQDRIRVFPFYARSSNEKRWEKTFVMWPIWTHARYEYANGKGSGFILFPLFGHARTTDQETWMVIPPFFQWARGQSGKERKFVALWPLVQYARGATDKCYLFPLWGRKCVGKDRMWFALWPIVESRQTARSEYRVDRFHVAPILYHETRRDWVGDGLAAEDPFRRHVKVWPLVRYRRERDAKSVRLLELWFGADVGSAERNWAPFWSIYTHERRGERVEDEFLWGLFRYRRGGAFGRELSLFPLFRFARSETDDAGEWSVLGGLAGAERQGLQRRIRLLYWIRTPWTGEVASGAKNDNP